MLAKILDGRPVCDLWKKPGHFVTGRRKEYHLQLWRVVAKMLAEDPHQRWPNTRVVAEKLAPVEKSFRAIAKYSYVATAPESGSGSFQLNDKVAFSKKSYEKLFDPHRFREEVRGQG